MTTRSLAGRAVRVVGAALLVVALLPGATIAAQDPFACGAGKGLTYTAPAPAALRTPGTHRIQWKSEFVDAYEGERWIDDGAINEITFDEAAPAYPNAVLLRLFRSTTILASGEVVVVDTIRPTQDARLYVNVSWFKDDKFFVGEFRLWYRYETSKNRWSEYQELIPGPEQAFCVELTSAIWKKGYGWE